MHLFFQVVHHEISRRGEYNVFPYSNIQPVICDEKILERISTKDVVLKRSYTSLFNTATIVTPLRQFYERFKQMFRNNTLLHLYAKENVEKEEFEQAEENLLHLIHTYEN